MHCSKAEAEIGTTYAQKIGTAFSLEEPEIFLRFILELCVCQSVVGISQVQGEQARIPVREQRSWPRVSKEVLHNMS